jgi:hypothetical protein
LNRIITSKYYNKPPEYQLFQTENKFSCLWEICLRWKINQNRHSAAAFMATNTPALTAVTPMQEFTPKVITRGGSQKELPAEAE